MCVCVCAVTGFSLAKYNFISLLFCSPIKCYVFCWFYKYYTIQYIASCTCHNVLCAAAVAATIQQWIVISSHQYCVYIDALYSPMFLEYLLIYARNNNNKKRQQFNSSNSYLPRSIYAVCIYRRADKTILPFDPQGTIYTLYMSTMEKKRRERGR